MKKPIILVILIFLVGCTSIPTKEPQIQSTQALPTAVAKSDVDKWIAMLQQLENNGVVYLQSPSPTASRTPTRTSTITNTPTATTIPTSTNTPTLIPTLIPTTTLTFTPIPTLILTTTLTFTPMPIQNVFFVAPTGDDNNSGTQDRPWKTIQKAASTVTAGAVVWIRGGTYFEHVVPANSGLDSQVIEYSGYPGETAIIDGTGVYVDPDYAADGLIQILGKSYLIFNNLTVRNAATNCINVDLKGSKWSEYITLSGLNVSTCTLTGILTHHTRYLTVQDSTIDKVSYSSGIGVWNAENAVINNNKITNVHIFHETQGGYEEALSIANVNTFQVYGNTLDFNQAETIPSTDPLWKADRIGIDVKESSQNGKVYLNKISHLDMGIYVDPWHAGVNGTPTLNHVDIYQNMTLNGGGIAVGAEQYDGTVEFVNIFNNVVVNASYAGIQVVNGHGNGLRRNIAIYNNTVYGALQAGGHGGAGIYVTTDHLATTTTDKPVVIKNNISVFLFISGAKAYVSQIVAGSAAIAAMVDASNNVVFGPQSCSQTFPLCVEVGQRTVIDPTLLFMNPAGNDFHLKQVGSVATNGGIVFNGLTIDYDGLTRSVMSIGAFK